MGCGDVINSILNVNGQIHWKLEHSHDWYILDILIITDKKIMMAFTKNILSLSNTETNKCFELKLKPKTKCHLIVLKRYIFMRPISKFNFR